MRLLCLFLMLILPAWAGEVTGQVTFKQETGQPHRSKGKPLSGYNEAERRAAERDRTGGAPYLSEVDNVVVFLEGPGLPTKPLSPVARMGQKGKVFTPHVLPVVTGSTVEFPNDDTPLLHHIYSNDTDLDTPRYRGPKVEKRVFSLKSGQVPTVYELFCGIHALMNAYVVVLPNRCFSPTRSGKYQIQGVPAGTYTLKAWHPRAKPSKLLTLGKVAVGEGKTVKDIVWE